MKKILTLVLAALIVFSGIAAFAEGWEIVVVPKDASNPWFVRMNVGVEEYAKAHPENTIYQKGTPEIDATLQAQLVQDLVAQGVDAICVVPVDPESLEPVLEQARAAGIVVVAHEGASLENVDYDIEAFKMKDFGTMAADKMAEGMGGEGEIIVFVGSLASTSHVGWAQAIVDRMTEAYPNIKVANAGGVFIETGNNAANSYEKAKEALKTYPNAKACFCPSATDTPSIALAIQEAGLTNQITFVAVGLPNANRTYVKDTSIDVLMSWDPGEVGQAMCRAAAAVKAGVELKTGDDLGVFGFNSIIVEDKVITGTEWRMLTAENVDEVDY